MEARQNILPSLAGYRYACGCIGAWSGAPFAIGARPTVGQYPQLCAYEVLLVLGFFGV